MFFLKDNAPGETTAISIHGCCWFNDGRSISGRGMMHAQSVEEERVAADRHARGYSSPNRGGRWTCADNVIANGSAYWYPIWMGTWATILSAFEKPNIQFCLTRLSQPCRYHGLGQYKPIACNETEHRLFERIRDSTPVPCIESHALGTSLPEQCWGGAGYATIPCIVGHRVSPEWFLRANCMLWQMSPCRW